jgi:tetratricopeptide (TPR) repeat protein
LVHSDLGDQARALSYYEQALPIRRAVGDRAGEAATLFNVAMLRDREGNTEEAITLLERVVALDEAIRRPTLESDRAVLARLRAKRRAPSRLPGS